MATLVLSASSLMDDEVTNAAGEDLGTVTDLMIDLGTGRIAYAVLSFGGFLGLGDKLFAVPWQALTVNTSNKKFIFHVNKEQLENAPGFDKDNWPDMANPEWGRGIYDYYSLTPYWEL